MTKLSVRFAILMALTVSILLSLGCVGSKMVQKTEDGYKPTHVAIGEMTVYMPTQSSMKLSNLKKMIVQDIEKSFRNQGVRFVSSRELPTTGVKAENLVLVDMTVSFQTVARGGDNSIDARVTYSLKRQSDGFEFVEGSAKSSDNAISQGASLTMDKAIEYAMGALCEKIKPLF